MRTRTAPISNAEIAAMARKEYSDAVNRAYRAKNREQFIVLCQRLVREVVRRTIRTPRLRPHRDDMASVGMAALIEQFDRGTKKPVKYPSSYFRRVVYIQILQDLYRQGILIKKGTKRPLLVMLETDLSGAHNDESNYLANAPTRNGSLADTIARCLTVSTELREGYSRAGRKLRTPTQFDAKVTATPRELRKQGYTWQAISELLGISMSVAFNAAKSRTQRSPQVLRQQGAKVRANRVLRKAEYGR